MFLISCDSDHGFTVTPEVDMYALEPAPIGSRLYNIHK